MGLILITSCTHKKEDTSEVVEEGPGIKTTVSVVHPSRQNIAEYIDLNGVTLFQKKDNIRANYTGYITALKYKMGDFIKAGDLYCTIGTKEQDALKSITTLDSSLANFQRPFAVRANASGLLSSINSLQGDYIAEGDILATMSEPGSLIIVVNVPYEYNQYAKTGNACVIRLPDGKTIRAQISGKMPTVDAGSQAQSFFIRLPDQALPENLNVSIRIPHEQKNNALCVPNAAVQTDELQKEFWLMKVLNDTLAIKIPVQTGLQNDSLTEIISTRISVNDQIILQGAYGLSDSTEVIINQ